MVIDIYKLVTFVLTFYKISEHLKPIAAASLTEYIMEFSPHAEIHIISNDFAQGLDALAKLHYASAYFDTQNSSFDLQNNSALLRINNFLPSATPDFLTTGKNMRHVKSILKTELTIETLGVLSEISSSQLIKDNLYFPQLVVVWPNNVISEEAALTILHSAEFEQSVKGFNIASELVVVFNKNESGGEIKDDSKKHFLFEVFNINDRHVVLNCSKGVVDYYCRFCGGVAVRRDNFYGLKINISAMEDPEINDDLNFETTAAGDLIFSESGFSARILQILQRSLNFTYKAMKATDWGRFFPENNSWAGSVKDVADGKANLGLAITTMRPSRAQMISFLPAADESVISAFFHNPDISEVRDIFARPFHPDLWAAVFSTWIVLAFFMIMFSIIRKRYDLHDSSGQPEPDFTHDSFIWALATACQQGWDDHPVAGSLRTIFISGSFTGVVAYAGYSAAIVSTLSLRVDPIKNPEQLLKSQLRIGIRQGFINEILQQNGTNDIMTSFQKKLQSTKANERYFNITEGHQHLLKHPYAFISTRDNMYDNLKVTSNDSEICKLRDMQILKRGFPTGHFVARNSPYKEFFRYIYVTILGPGISWKLRANYTYKRRCLEATDNTGNALGAKDVFTAFMILSGGYLLSLVFIIIEKLLRAGKTFSYIR